MHISCIFIRYFWHWTRRNKTQTFIRGINVKNVPYMPVKCKKTSWNFMKLFNINDIEIATVAADFRQIPSVTAINNCKMMLQGRVNHDPSTIPVSCHVSARRLNLRSGWKTEWTAVAVACSQILQMLASCRMPVAFRRGPLSTCQRMAHYIPTSVVLKLLLLLLL